MNIELRATRALNSTFSAFYLLMATLPWLLALPLWARLAACAAVIAAAWPHFRSPGRARALRIEPHGGLSVITRRRSLSVRSFRAHRLLRCWIELALKLDDGRKMTVFILPGVCDADALRCLRRYLLQHKANEPAARWLPKWKFMDAISALPRTLPAANGTGNLMMDQDKFSRGGSKNESKNQH